MRSVDLNITDEEALGSRESEKSLATRDGFRLSVMRFGMRSGLSVGVHARKWPMKRSQQTSAEPLACSVRRATLAGLKVFTSRLSGRTSARCAFASEQKCDLVRKAFGFKTRV